MECNFISFVTTHPQGNESIDEQNSTAQGSGGKMRGLQLNWIYGDESLKSKKLLLSMNIIKWVFNKNFTTLTSFQTERDKNCGN